MHFTPLHSESLFSTSIIRREVVISTALFEQRGRKDDLQSGRRPMASIAFGAAKQFSPRKHCHLPGCVIVSLFRREILDAASDRLHGEVVFTQPLSVKLFAGALFAILTIAGIWVSVGTYSRIETVPGMLVTDIPSAKIVATQPGIIVDLKVEEGEVVEQGQPLLVINSDREAAAGGGHPARLPLLSVHDGAARGRRAGGRGPVGGSTWACPRTSGSSTA